jgi:hypothetical protein
MKRTNYDVTRRRKALAGNCRTVFGFVVTTEIPACYPSEAYFPRKIAILIGSSQRFLKQRWAFN